MHKCALSMTRNCTPFLLQYDYRSAWFRSLWGVRHANVEQLRAPDKFLILACSRVHKIPYPSLRWLCLQVSECWSWFGWLLRCLHTKHFTKNTLSLRTLNKMQQDSTTFSNLPISTCSWITYRAVLNNLLSNTNYTS